MSYRIKFGDDSVVMPGADFLIAPFVLMEIDGVVSAIGNVLPEFCVRLYEVSVKRVLKRPERCNTSF
ncbi:MAG: hypothetical protein DRP25_06480 [Thermotoga sp.]|nr:MAG: hypothetical protein DRP25_06480 [Thermotoga sp.]